MNMHLATILDWANTAEVDLSNAQITLGCSAYDYELDKDKHFDEIVFYHRKEKHRNIINLKRAVELKEEGKPPLVELQATIKFGEQVMKIKYEGAFTCKTEHYCSPTPWKNEQLEEVTEEVTE